MSVGVSGSDTDALKKILLCSLKFSQSATLVSKSTFNFSQIFKMLLTDVSESKPLS